MSLLQFLHFRNDCIYFFASWNIAGRRGEAKSREMSSIKSFGRMKCVGVQSYLLLRRGKGGGGWGAQVSSWSMEERRRVAHRTPTNQLKWQVSDFLHFSLLLLFLLVAPKKRASGRSEGEESERFLPPKWVGVSWRQFSRLKAKTQISFRLFLKSPDGKQDEMLLPLSARLWPKWIKVIFNWILHFWRFFSHVP